ncbi:MAG: translation elongation factor 4 [candidate division FCPU426 bacterium]
MDQKQIRNFCIIAHIDHGKSTLADRLLEDTGTVEKRDMKEQLLDGMDLERERGITIKAKAVRLNYKAKDGQAYVLNLIDTPGHVDFNYEVSRSLAACEGALLVVDASQGVEAQTMANAYLAIDGALSVIPVINKIDLPGAQPELAREQIEEHIGLDASDAILASAKEGIGISEILEAVVARIPAPQGDAAAPPKALIFDSQYDPYRGVIIYVRLVDGELKRGDRIRMMLTGKEFNVLEIGVMAPKPSSRESLGVGEVGYLIAGIKTAADVAVGDTVTLVSRPAAEALPGYKPVQSMVFAGLFPVDADRYGDMRDAMEKFKLSDSAFKFEPETSVGLGFGFRCGFLGLLHMEIVQERLEREYGIDLIATAPSVEYHVTRTNGESLVVDNPSKLPSPSVIEKIEEPFIRGTLLMPSEYVGSVMKLCMERRGIQTGNKYLSPTRVQLIYEMPLGEVVLDFFDKLKSLTKGYASFDYELLDYRASDIVRVDILLNAENVDALAFMIHRSSAEGRGRAFCEKLKELIPRQMFQIPIQAAIGAKVIARETISAMRKDVTAKCYGGDISRKRKLLENQKEGKKRMKNLGSVSIPQEAFMAVLKLD